LHDRIGRFQLADNGTLFLDEVGEIPLAMQSKLLRVLQEGEFERVGEDRTRRVNVRVIAATNRRLDDEIQASHFRQDVYFRLSVFPLEAPPLRERREDIPLLAAHLIKKTASRLNVPMPRLSEANVRQLSDYSWPGNIRELQNVIERAVILSVGGTLSFDLQEPRIAGKQESLLAAPFTRKQFLDLERRTIEEALRKSGGKIYGAGGAAELLGMRPTTVSSKIAALGIKRLFGRKTGRSEP
jgi:transcriptional regulator with GAF, ATPase, and Fis domain